MSVDYVSGWPNEYTWVVVCGFIFSAALSFGMGANDAANAYGTSVGAGVLKLWQAYVMATIFETMGAALLGYKVTNYFRKAVVDIDMYDVYSLDYGNGSCSSCWTELNKTDFIGCENANSSVDYFPPSMHLSNTSACDQFTSVQYMIGSAAALLGAAIWMIIATITKIPVSTTHSAMGATLGFSIVIKGLQGISWWDVGKAVISWVTSPLLSGILGIAIYSITRFAVLDRHNSFIASLTSLPIYYAVVIFVVVFAILIDGSKYVYLNNIPLWMNIVISAALAILCAIGVRFFLQERVKRWVLKSGIETPSVSAFYSAVPNKSGMATPTTPMGTTTNSQVSLVPSAQNSPKKVSIITPDTLKLHLQKNQIYDSGVVMTPPSGALSPMTPGSPTTFQLQQVEAKTLTERLKKLKYALPEPAAASKVFSSLQILSACLKAFTHGSNDVANSAGNLVGIWVTFSTGYVGSDESNDKVFLLLILYAAACMIVGLWLLGHKVIETVGNDITDITPACGFCMEIATALTVLLCTKIGIPVSTTHCSVGAVIFVGYYRTRSVKWSVFRNIAIAWLVTIPVAGLISAALTYGMLMAAGLSKS